MRVGHDSKGDAPAWLLAKLEVQADGEPPITDFDIPPEVRLNPRRRAAVDTARTSPAAASARAQRLCWFVYHVPGWRASF